MHRVLLLPFALALTGCQEPTRLDQQRQEPAVGPHSAVAYLEITPMNATVGQEVTVSVRAKAGSSLGRIGSFTLALRYDSLCLSFVDAPTLQGGLRVHNAAESGVVRVAGASPDGFGDGDLFQARFRVIQGDPTSGLALEVTEISAASSFRNMAPSLQVVRRYAGQDHVSPLQRGVR